MMADSAYGPVRDAGFELTLAGVAADDAGPCGAWGSDAVGTANGRRAMGYDRRLGKSEWRLPRTDVRCHRRYAVEKAQLHKAQLQKRSACEAVTGGGYSFCTCRDAVGAKLELGMGKREVERHAAIGRNRRAHSKERNLSET